eukprot:sb/3470451/
MSDWQFTRFRPYNNHRGRGGRGGGYNNNNNNKRPRIMGPKGAELSRYRDQQYKGSKYEQEQKLLKSTTLYVGNLSFYTTEEQVHEVFRQAGDIKRIIMGLDRIKKTPCGFCFVEYFDRLDAETAIRFLNGAKLDDRQVRADWDWGFEDGRQYGRGKGGGQIRDDYRQDFDDGRGGYGHHIQESLLESANAHAMQLPPTMDMDRK